MLLGPIGIGDAGASCTLDRRSHWPLVAKFFAACATNANAEGDWHRSELTKTQNPTTGNDAGQCHPDQQLFAALNRLCRMVKALAYAAYRPQIRSLLAIHHWRVAVLIAETRPAAQMNPMIKLGATVWAFMLPSINAERASPVGEKRRHGLYTFTRSPLPLGLSAGRLFASAHDCRRLGLSLGELVAVAIAGRCCIRRRHVLHPALTRFAGNRHWRMLGPPEAMQRPGWTPAKTTADAPGGHGALCRSMAQLSIRDPRSATVSATNAMRTCALNRLRNASVI